MARITETTPSMQPDKNDISFDMSGNETVTLPQGYSVSDAELFRDGQDLTMTFDGQADVTVNNYFSASDESAIIHDSNGGMLNQGLVNSFLQSSPEYAQASSMNDASPIGAVEEASGGATITRLDGTSEPVSIGTVVFEGDVVQTTNTGAVNIIFSDETSLAISENAKMAIDNYQFDPQTESGETNVSVLRGVFVYTSGLIGRDDPDDVKIETPVGTIGIRGTIIAGKINPDGESEISVLEGAIVVSNGAGETTLSEQFETVKISSFGQEMQAMGVQPAAKFTQTYGSVSDVLPNLFSSINDNIEIEAQKDTAPEALSLEEEESEGEVPSEEINSSDDTTQGNNEDISVEGENTQSDDAAIMESMDFDDGLMEITGEANEMSKSDIINRLTKTIADNSNTDTNTIFTKVRDFINAEEPTAKFIANTDVGARLTGDDIVFEGVKAGTIIGKVVIGGYDLATGGTVTIEQQTPGLPVFTTAQDGTNPNIFYVTLSGAGQAYANTLNSVSLDVTIHTGAEIINVASGLSFSFADAKVILNGVDDENFGYDYHTEAASAIEIPAGQPIINAGGDVVIKGTTPVDDIELLDNHDYDSVDVVGDLNNDGYDDIVAGTTEFNSDEGKIAILTGDNSVDGYDEGNPNYKQNPEDDNSFQDRFGTKISAIGDFDGDGFDDFMVASDSNKKDSDNSGDVAIITDIGNNFDVNEFKIFSDRTTNGQDGTTTLPNTFIDGIGDFNGDGRSDIIVGTDKHATVIFGTENDGALIGDNLGTNGFRIEDTNALNLITGGSAGDINGDGFDDFAVSLRDGGSVNTYVVYGFTNRDIINNPINIGSYNLADLENPDLALKIEHNNVTNPQASNYQVTELGDVDGDGFDDIQVGGDNNQYIVHGAAGGSQSTIITNNSPNDIANNIFGDSNTNENGISASGENQSLVGDVAIFDDNTFQYTRMSGGNSDNRFIVNQELFKSIDGGEGYDTIQLNHPTTNTFSFLHQDYEDIQGIEEINFGGTGQTLTLDARNIFNLLKSSDTNRLDITGSGTLDLDGGTDIETQLEAFNGDANSVQDHGSDGNFTHYEIGGYNLYIEDTVTVT